MQTRRIRLSFPETGESVLADLLDTEAPGTCELMWRRLPVEAKAIHGMYSGAEVFMLLENPPEEEELPAGGGVTVEFPGNCG